MGKYVKAIEKLKVQNKSKKSGKQNEFDKVSLVHTLSVSKKKETSTIPECVKKTQASEQIVAEKNGKPLKNSIEELKPDYYTIPDRGLNSHLDHTKQDRIKTEKYSENKIDINEQIKLGKYINKEENEAQLLELRRQFSKYSSTKAKTLKEIFSKKLNKQLYTLNRPNAIISEQFKITRTLVMNAIKAKNIRTILITSSLPFEGKSFFSSNFAVSLARGLNKHVLLIDTDFNNPSQHKIFSLSSDKGLSDFLGNEQYELDDLIKKTMVPKLSLLPAGTYYEQSAELLSSEIMNLFMREVKHRYDDRIIVLDSSPLIISHSIALADKVDGTLIIVKSGKTERKLVSKSIEMIGRKNIIGIIMNYSKVFSKNYTGYYGKNALNKKLFYNGLKK